MPKVVSGKGFDEFVQTGKHQTIDEPKKGAGSPTIEPPQEVKELIQKTEAESAQAIDPQGKEEDGLETEDQDLAERARQRIGKKHREMKAAEALAKKLKEELEETESFSKAQYQRAQAAEEEAARLRKELEGKQTPPVSTEKSGLQPPDENDPKFRNDKGEFQLKVYEKARDEYVKAQIREELKAEAAEAEWQGKMKAFEARVEKARETHPDFNEVVGAQDLAVLPFIQRFMVDSEMGAEIGYHFGKNPDELKRISALHPIRASAELGKLEARLEAAKEKPPVKTESSKPAITPPAPITPLSGQGSAGTNTDPAKMSPKELLAYTREREAAKKRARLGR